MGVSRDGGGDAVMTYRPVKGDRVRVGLKSVFVQAEAVELGITDGMTLHMEVPLPNGVTIMPLVCVTGLDRDWFAADYVDLKAQEREAIEAYFRERPSNREILAKAMASEPRDEEDDR